jgi:outer membrane protein TolC
MFFIFLGLFIAQFGDGFARSLGVDEAIGLVLEESQDIRKAEANVRRMDAILTAAAAARWPKLDATASYQTNAFGLPIQASASASVPAAIDNIGALGVSASMPIYSFGKIGYALDMARGGVEIAKKSRELAEIETRAAAVQLYWTAKVTDESVRVAEKSLKNTKNAQRQLTATGRANRSNLVKIAADVAAREIDLENAKFNRDSAHRMLKVYAGIGEYEPMVLTSDFPNSFAAKTKKEINPLEWHIYELQAKIADAEKRQNYAGYLPTIAATGSYNYLRLSDSLENIGSFYPALKSSNVGISVTMPLFDAGARMAQATASAMNAISAREDLDKSRKIKTAEYNELIQKHAHLRQSLKDILRAKDLAEKAYDLSKSRFLAGQTSATELSDVERTMSQMEMAVFNAKLQILTTEESIRKYETR